MRQRASGLKEAAVTSGWDFGVVGKLSEGGTLRGPKAAETAEELFERAKLLHKAQKYKQAVELIEEAHALQPKVSTALSAANLRLKLGQWDKAAAAYRRVLQAAGGDSADAAMRGMAGMVPSEAEAGMARGKLREAE